MDIQTELTSEEQVQVVAIFDKFVLSILPPEHILSNFKPEQIKAYLKKISKNE